MDNELRNDRTPLKSYYNPVNSISSPRHPYILRYAHTFTDSEHCELTYVLERGTSNYEETIRWKEIGVIHSAITLSDFERYLVDLFIGEKWELLMSGTALRDRLMESLL